MVNPTTSSGSNPTQSFGSSLLNWLLSSSFFCRRATQLVGAVVIHSGLVNQSDTTAVAGAIIFLLEAILSRYCSVNLTRLAEAPTPAPWVKPQVIVMPASDELKPPAGLGHLH